MHFSRVVTSVADLEIWNAASGGFSFAISHENRDGPGLHGRPGVVASLASAPIQQAHGQGDRLTLQNVRRGGRSLPGLSEASYELSLRQHH